MSALVEVLIALLVSLLVAGRVLAAARERRAVVETDEIVAWLRSMRRPPSIGQDERERRLVAMLRHDIALANAIRHPGAAVIISRVS